MDYNSILKLADKKQEMNDTINGFSLKRKGNNSYGGSSGPDKAQIEAFKARKAKEELKRMETARREKERLLSLRAQSGKSMKRSKMMKYRTKDNDFSRMVLTAEQIEEQRRVEEKLKKKGITDVCERMKTRIDLEEEESNLPKKRQRNKPNVNNSQTITNTNVNNNQTSNGLKKRTAHTKNNNNNNNKKRQQTTAPLSYQQLMNLAVEKANIEKPSLGEELIKELEERKKVRPMTQKEKDELKEEQFYKDRANKGLARLPTAAEKKVLEKIAQNKPQIQNKQQFNKNLNHNINQKPSLEKPNSSSKAMPTKPNLNQRQSGALSRENSIEEQISAMRRDHNMSNNRNIQNQSFKRDINENKNLNPSKSNIVNKKLDNTKVCDRRTEPMNYNKINSNPKLNNQNKPSVVPNSRDRPVVPTQQRQRQQQEQQRRPLPQQQQQQRRPLPPQQRAQPPPQRERPSLPPIGSTYKRGMFEDPAQYVVEDEYDEDEDDMSDFIDDGPEEPEEEDYSKAIREIFGYDKRKYRNVVEDDDDVEEANYAQCMREEQKSARIGLQEDLEDMRQEEEEKRLKALKKKKLKK